MVQVLRLHALSAEGPGLIPSLGTKIPQTAAWSKKFRIMWGESSLDCKEISPEYSLEGLLLKPKFQYFGHLMWRADSFGKTLMLQKIEDRGEGDDRK